MGFKLKCTAIIQCTKGCCVIHWQYAKDHGCCVKLSVSRINSQKHQQTLLKQSQRRFVNHNKLLGLTKCSLQHFNVKNYLLKLVANGIALSKELVQCKAGTVSALFSSFIKTHIIRFLNLANQKCLGRFFAIQPKGVQGSILSGQRF